MVECSDTLWGRLLWWRGFHSPPHRDCGRQADAIAHFWAQKLAENRHILALIEAGTFTVGGKPVLDAETLVEVRQWATQRVAACEACLAARNQNH